MINVDHVSEAVAADFDSTYAALCNCVHGQTFTSLGFDVKSGVEMVRPKLAKVAG
jgi:hypothetical protein